MPDLFFGRKGFLTTLVATYMILSLTAQAQHSPGPQPVPLPPPTVAPVDTPYPGTISLLVDVTNVTARIFQVRETIPIKGRELTLLYQEWLPGTHSPSNPIAAFAGLVVTANGKTVPWQRDRVNMYAFHIERAERRDFARR